MNNLSSGNRFFFVKDFKGKFYPDSLLRSICENRQKLYSCRLRVNNQVITDYTIQDPTQSSMDQSIHWDKKEEQTNVLIQSGTFSLETRKIKSFECLDPIKCIVHVTWNEISLALSVTAVLTSVYMSIELPRHQNELLAFLRLCTPWIRSNVSVSMSCRAVEAMAVVQDGRQARDHCSRLCFWHFNETSAHF